MQGSDASINHVNKNQELPTRSAEASLITLERAQKLDLLVHLISNLRQSLVICGPSGIGKTRVLDELRASKKDAWHIDTIDGSSNLSFESFQNQLSQFVAKNFNEYKNQELISTLSVLDKQHQKIIIIIDDAGRLVPGLIATIIQYAAASVCLRIVFSMTNDELHLKNSSDRAIDNCHFIEVPPLSEKQCGVFLQNLSALPDAVVPFNAINDSLTEKLYRETHGIPGKIISELPKLANYKLVDSYKLGGGALLLILVLSTVGISWLISDDSDLQQSSKQINTPVVLKEAEIVEIAAPIIKTAKKERITDISKAFLIKKNDIVNPSITNTDVKKDLLVAAAETIVPATDIQQQQEVEELITIKAIEIDKEVVKKVEKTFVVDAKPKPAKVEKVAVIPVPVKVKPVKLAPVKQEAVAKKVIKPPAVVKKIKKLEEKPVVKVVKVADKKMPVDLKSTAVVDDRQWVLKQAEKNYTIQLMVLSKREAIIELLKKNKALKENIKYFQLNKQGKQSYVVIYGSFKNKEKATKKIKSLPAKYRKSWVRSFRSLQKKINN
ncbi:MAG: SPOR domain-containing protein [Methylococcaceae bacterium]